MIDPSVMHWAATEAGVAGEATRIGPLGIGVVALLAAWAAAAAWLALHPHTIRHLPREGRRPPVDRVVTRLDALTQPLRGRLGVDGITLVGLLAGLAVVLLLAVGFTSVLEDVLDGGGIAALDTPATHWLATHRERRLTEVLLALTRIGNTDAQAAVLTLVCAVAAIVSRSWRPVLVGVVGGAGIGLVIVVAKELISRQRPPQPFALIASNGFSFPSGHATGAAAVGMLCAWILCRWVVHTWALQVAVWATAIAMVGLIGFSRPYLGVHFVTDVVAGWALGAGWATSVIVLASWRFHPSPPESVPPKPDHGDTAAAS